MICCILTVHLPLSHAAQVVARNYSLCTHFGELDYANSIEEEKDKINDITRLQNLAKPLPAHVLVSLNANCLNYMQRN